MPSGYLNRIVSAEELQKLLHVWKFKDDTIVFTNGCFDLVHTGHTRYLQSAASLGSRLIVGLNSDASVTRLKGPGRPVTPERDRAEMLAALHCVDAVVIFTEDTPLELIRMILPDVLVKGGDYREETVAGADTVKSAGGKVCIVPFVDGYSSTNMMKKIRQAE